MEGAGEDRRLGELFAVARVKGFQGDDLAANDAMMACVKHFAAYGGAEAGLDYNSVDISERTLREVDPPPYKAGFDAGATTGMASFNEISGVPAHGILGCCRRCCATNGGSRASSSVTIPATRR
ncbi:glycoside hydrolase family 3 N-terminal domain-containing protein [Sphingomonas sp. MMS24-JH45]